MTKILAILGLFLTFSAQAYHNGEETDVVCSPQNPKVCAHLHFLAETNTTTEGVFIAHVVTPHRQEVKGFNVDLWMDMKGGHGHGGGPVDIEPQNLNHFKIQNAWFVMTGRWLVKLKFDLGGMAHEIAVPIDITE